MMFLFGAFFCQRVWFVRRTVSEHEWTLYAVRFVRFMAMGSRVSFLTQWKAVGIRTAAMGGFCLCFNMFQLNILFLPIFLHGSMGANMYGIRACGAILFLKHSCSIMQRVFFCFDLTIWGNPYLQKSLPLRVQLDTIWESIWQFFLSPRWLWPGWGRVQVNRVLTGFGDVQRNSGQKMPLPFGASARAASLLKGPIGSEFNDGFAHHWLLSTLCVSAVLALWNQRSDVRVAALKIVGWQIVLKQ